MKNKGLLKTIILFFIILFFCLICFLLYLVQVVSKENSPQAGKAIIRQEERTQTKNTIKESKEDNDTIKIADRVTMYSPNTYLSSLLAANMGTRIIEKDLDEGIELDNGYISYNDGTIEIRKTLTNIVRNIIFTNKYDGDVVKNVNLKTSLKEILELYPENSFGSLEKDYLGYLSNDFYYFFYDDEISVYGYTYKEDEKFEKILEKYLEDKDLDKFVSSIKVSLRYYDYLEYDPDIKKAHIMFSNRGFEIDIEDNNPKGIILYSNYYITEKTKKYVEDGVITLREKEDSVEKIEKERRANR